MNIEIIKIIASIITPIASVLIGALLSAPIINFIEQFKKRKLKNYIESQSALDKLDDNFQNEFIKPNLKEIYFYLQTGISTNEKSIQKFIELKDKLGGNYNWKKIKSAQLYVDLDSDSPSIKLDKFQEHTLNIMWLLIFGLLLLSAIAVIILSFYIDKIPFKDYVEIIFLVLLPLLCGVILMQLIKSSEIAKAMNKRLKSIESRE